MTPLERAADQLLTRIEPDGHVRAQISPALIAILIEFLPKLIEQLLSQCNEGANDPRAVQAWCNAPGIRGRWRRRLINLKARQYFGQATMDDLGGAEFGEHVMTIGQDPQNLSAIKQAMETTPPTWGTL